MHSNGIPQHPNAVVLPPPQYIQMRCNTRCSGDPTSMFCNAMQYIQMQCSAFKNNAIHPMVWCCFHLNVMMQYIQIPNAAVLLPPQYNTKECNDEMQCNTQSSGAAPTSTSTAKSISFSSHLAPNAPTLLFNSSKMQINHKNASEPQIIIITPNTAPSFSKNVN